MEFHFLLKTSYNPLTQRNETLDGTHRCVNLLRCTTRKAVSESASTKLPVTDFINLVNKHPLLRFRVLINKFTKSSLV